MQEWEEKALAHNQGVEKGIERGMERMNVLVKCLLKDDRTDDLMRATTDLEFRETLFTEYEI